jgi:uncharacterized protein YegJ (DUF2314 family)
MVKENPNNIVAKCADCSEKQHKLWQRKNKNLIINRGDFIKIAFTDTNGTEHLWLKVSQATTQGSHKVYIGRINNIPVILSSYKYNQQIKVGRDEIEDYIKGERRNKK